MRRKDKQTSDAYKEGWRAFANLLPCSENPYQDEDRSADWNDGWSDFAKQRPGLYQKYFAEDEGVSDTNGSKINTMGKEFQVGMAAHVRGLPRFKNPYKNESEVSNWNAGWDSVTFNEPNWPFQLFVTRKGNVEERITTSFFYFTALVLIVCGVIFVNAGLESLGVSLVSFSPIFMLYPAIRFFFGGKGGIVPAAVTIFVEKYLRYKISSALEGDRKNQRRP